MLSQFFNNFDMFKHSEVKLLLDKQEITSSDLDFDFTINNSMNSDLTASINIYNLEIDKLSSLKIVCNGAVAFIAKGVDITDISVRTNEVSVQTTINAKYSNVKIPNILEKGKSLMFKGKPLKVDNQEVKVTKDYIFSEKDSEQAKLGVILKGEGFGAFCVNLNQLVIIKDEAANDTTTTNKAKQGTASGGGAGNNNTKSNTAATASSNQASINQHELLLLQAIESYAAEELALISLYNPFLLAGKQLNYTPKNTKTVKAYTITSVVTSYSFNKGLIQTLQAKRGSRLQDFLTNQKANSA